MIRLGRTYQGYPQGAIVELTPELESALIAQGLATTSAGPVTPGAQSVVNGGAFSQRMLVGTAAVAIGASSVVVSSDSITATSRGFAVISQAAADATATQVLRVSCAAGAMTITVNANATAQTEVSYFAIVS